MKYLYAAVIGLLSTLAGMFGVFYVLSLTARSGTELVIISMLVAFLIVTVGAGALLIASCIEHAERRILQALQDREQRFEMVRQ